MIPCKTTHIPSLWKEALIINACICRFFLLTPLSVTPQHAFDQISQGTPEILATVKIVFVNKEHVMLEAGIEMRFEAKVEHDVIVVTVNVRVHAIQAFEHLADQRWEWFGECDSYISRMLVFKGNLQCCVRVTGPAGKHLLIVNVSLHPSHEMLDIFRRRHLGRPFVCFRVLPEVFKPVPNFC